MSKESTPNLYQLFSADDFYDEMESSGYQAGKAAANVANAKVAQLLQEMEECKDGIRNLAALFKKQSHALTVAREFIELAAHCSQIGGWVEARQALHRIEEILK